MQRMPIIINEEIEGVINSNVKPSHSQHSSELDFLSRVEGTIAGIIKSQKLKKAKVELEQQVQQTQRLEAMGTLAGGIAHDFNNILAGIFGYTELAIDKSKDPEVKKLIENSLKGAHRARDLVKQILTFSRKTEQAKQPLQMSLLIKEALKMLRSSIPTTIEIKSDIEPQGLVLADPTQIHQIIMNLCTNAYHTM